MPNLKTYDLFISHAWFYNKGYNRVVELLDGEFEGWIGLVETLLPGQV